MSLRQCGPMPDGQLMSVIIVKKKMKTRKEEISINLIYFEIANMGILVELQGNLVLLTQLIM